MNKKIRVASKILAVHRSHIKQVQAKNKQDKEDERVRKCKNLGALNTLKCKLLAAKAELDKQKRELQGGGERHYATGEETLQRLHTCRAPTAERRENHPLVDRMGGGGRGLCQAGRDEFGGQKAS